MKLPNYNKSAVIYDTTLRDGTQGTGISFNVEDKLRITKRLDELRFDYIEGGYPGSNQRDVEFFKRVQSLHLQYAKLAAFGSTRKAGTKAESDRNMIYLIEADTPVVTIFGKSSLFQVKDALRTTPEENLHMITDSVTYLKRKGKEVVYDAEHFFDGFQENREYALRTIATAKSAGADFLVLCDTNGGTKFYDVAEIVREVRKNSPNSRLGIHTHNDIGHAVANSEAAMVEGAEMVQGTINGFGERVGNANLITLLGNLFKGGIPTRGRIDVGQLRSLSRFVYELANIPADPRQPYVGDAAFAHKGGGHVDGVNKNPHLYEHIDPALFGNRRNILFSDLAGTAHIEASEQFGLSKRDPIARAIVQEIKQREHMGYSYEAADGSLELLVRQMKGENIKLFDVLGYSILDEQEGGNPQPISASIRIEINGNKITQTRYGNGPVNALDLALRAALEREYPELKRLELVDYRVREIPEQLGTSSRVRVLIESRLNCLTFGTVGVGENNTRAALEALVDSFHFAHLHIQDTNRTG